MQEIRKSRNSEKIGIRKKLKLRKEKIRKSQKLKRIKIKQGKNINQPGHGWDFWSLFLTNKFDAIFLEVQIN